MVTKKEVPTLGKAGTSTTKTKTYGKNQDAYIIGVSVSYFTVMAVSTAFMLLLLEGMR